MAIASSILGVMSQIRDSSVGKRAEGRRSHQIFVASSMISVSTMVCTERWYSE